MRPPATLRPAWVEIDLDALRRNTDRLGALAGNRPLRAVLKADAYGHGAVEVARTLAAHGIDRFAVALVEEGVELRRAGIGGEILVMGTCRPGQCPAVRHHRLVPTISSPGQLQMWTDAVRDAKTPQPVHLKINTGMNRLGMSLDELEEALARLRETPALRVAGLMSHLADADLPGGGRTVDQLATMKRAVEQLGDEERSRLEVHVANSAGLLHHEIGVDSSVRPGLALLGYDPAGGLHDLEPVMAVKARIVQMHDLRPGERVGYGGTWRARRPSRVGTVPLGYADGYPRTLGGRGTALTAGRHAPIVGAVSMDMLAIDCTDTAASEGDEVVLLGQQGEARITASELATTAGTLVYDVLCGFGLRLPKLSVAAGETTAVFCRFESRAPVRDAD